MVGKPPHLRTQRERERANENAAMKAMPCQAKPSQVKSSQVEREGKERGGRNAPVRVYLMSWNGMGWDG